MLIQSPRFHLDDANVGPGFRLALAQNKAFDMQCVTHEHRMVKPYPIPPEVRHRVLAHVANAHPQDQRKSEPGIYQRFSEFGSCRIVIVEMQLIRVHRQEREPDIVRLRDRSPEGKTIDVPHFEVLVVAPHPSLLDGHASLPWTRSRFNEALRGRNRRHISRPEQPGRGYWPSNQI